MEPEIRIHPTAIVHPSAVFGPGTTVGPYSVIGEGVVTGARCEILEHVVLRGPLKMGDQVRVFPFAALGMEPQHLKYKGEPTSVVIGNRVTIRESVTIHRGTMLDKGVTTVGDDCFIMAYTHVAHDCTIGQRVILANAIQIAGHVSIDDDTSFGGHSAIAQFCRIGRQCYIGGATNVRRDIAPFLLGKGGEFEPQGINVIGLGRRGVPQPNLARLKVMYKIFFLQNLTVGNAIEKIELELGLTDEVKEFVDFVKSSKLGVYR